MGMLSLSPRFIRHERASGGWVLRYHLQVHRGKTPLGLTYYIGYLDIHNFKSWMIDLGSVLDTNISRGSFY